MQGLAWPHGSPVSKYLRAACEPRMSSRCSALMKALAQIEHQRCNPVGEPSYQGNVLMSTGRSTAEKLRRVSHPYAGSHRRCSLRRPSWQGPAYSHAGRCHSTPGRCGSACAASRPRARGGGAMTAGRPWPWTTLQTAGSLSCAARQQRCAGGRTGALCTPACMQRWPGFKRGAARRWSCCRRRLPALGMCRTLR
jgi:hypothetical protein